MSTLKIVKYGDPVLKQKCKPVTDINADIKTLVANMIETMYAAPGVGLAASQVGVPLRLCVIDVRPDGKRAPIVLINPKITAKKGKIKEEEGCLSLPGLNAIIKRHKEVRVEAINENGMPVVVEGKELLSRALQHELDHLEGKLFIDYLYPWQRAALKREIKKLKKEGIWK